MASVACFPNNKVTWLCDRKIRDFQGKCVNLGCSLWRLMVENPLLMQRSNDFLGGHCDDFVRYLSKDRRTRDVEKVQIATSSRKEFIKSLSVAEGKLEVCDFYQKKIGKPHQAPSYDFKLLQFSPHSFGGIDMIYFSRSRVMKTSDTRRTSCILPDMKTATLEPQNLTNS